MKSQLEDREKLFAFLDCRPTRVFQVFRLLEHELGRKACICVHQGKTAGAAQLTTAARMEKPDAVVWRGDPELPLTKQGLTVSGAPVGQVEFVQAQLTKNEHEALLEMIPQVPNVQVAWLLILFCALILGGLGTGNSERTRDAAHWGSWADCLEMIKIRHLDARRIVQGMARCFQAVEEAASRLRLMGVDTPNWEVFSAGLRPESQTPGKRPDTTQGGRKWRLRRSMSNTGRKWCGLFCFPHRGRCLSHHSRHVETRMESEPFRVLLLRRPLPLSVRDDQRPRHGTGCDVGPPIMEMGHL